MHHGPATAGSAAEQHEYSTVENIRFSPNTVATAANLRSMTTFGLILCLIQLALVAAHESFRVHRDVEELEPLRSVKMLISARLKVSFLSCTVTFYANLAHSLTRSP